MSEQPSDSGAERQPQPPDRPASAGASFRPASADAPTAPLPPHPAPSAGPTAVPQTRLQCPFCAGKRFDFGRDLYAGWEPVLYCRKSPEPGQHVDEKLNLPMKAAVCLDCGFVATMVDLAQLHAPVRREMHVADLLAHSAGAAAHLARPVEEVAAEALSGMSTARPAPDEVLERLGEKAAGAKPPAAKPQAPGSPGSHPADPRGGSIFLHETKD